MAGLGDYEKKKKGERGFKMGGPALYKDGPLFKKAGPEIKEFNIDDQIQLSEHEDIKGTKMTGGSESEVSADLEDRIEFLKNDIEDGNTDPKVKAQLIKLQNRLNN